MNYEECMKKLYFKAKTYGYGWYPASWEGWLIIAIYAGCVITIATLGQRHISNGPDVLLYITLPILLLTAILIWISYKTGEKPRWRWGKDT